ncbi:MAG: serine/threonine-protein kinase [Polyangiaceae bacterium]
MGARVQAREDLKATFRARVAELGLAETQVAGGLDATVRPTEGDALPAARAWTRPEPAELPRISLTYAAESSDTARPDASTRADLEVRGPIGEGGMGVVHAARQRSLDREVALKTLKRTEKSAAATQQLLREAVITGRLEHPGIVPVHALGIDDQGAPVLVMKRIEGVEWRALLADPNHPAWRHRPGDRLEAELGILMQVCQALEFAHDRGVIHCDIKPENVMLGSYGEVYLVDWGIAVRRDDPAFSSRQGLVGTPVFMPPELVSGGPIGPQTDVYLLGASLHFVLTRRFRHEGKNLNEVLSSAFFSEPVAYEAHVPPELAALCNAATSRRPEDRPASAAEFRQKLADFLQHKSSIALSREAQNRLERLRTMLPADDEAPEDLSAAYQLVTECRFGFAQASKEWPDNPQAKRGAFETVVLAAELELRQGHVAAAEALLSELGDAPAELRERLRALHKAQAHARAEEARLRAIAHDQDSSVAVRERTKGLAAMSGAAVAIASFSLSQPNPTKIKPEGLLTFAGVVFVVIVGVTLIWRRKLFANQFSRRLSGLLLLSGGTLLVSRSFGLWLGMPAPLILVQDLLLLAAIAGSTSIFVLRWLFPLPILLVAAAAYCRANPSVSPIVFSLVAILAPPSIALALWRHNRDVEREREEALPESQRSEW